MARKSTCFLATYKYMFDLAAVVVLCCALIVLQRRCMNVGDGDFVTGYCLSNSHMRAVLAAILTVIGLILSSSITSAVEAYRSAKLASGINEGVYIAMASQSVKYRLRALLTAWGPAMMLIILCTNAPNAIQTLANLGIKTAGVYVRNPSTAVIFDAYSYYNASVTQTDFSDVDLQTAGGVLTKMRDYTSRATSTIVDHAGGVATTVIRDGYLGPLNISHSDATNAFKHLETIVTLTSTCTSALSMGPLSEAVPASSSTVNLTYFLPAVGFAEAIVYDVLYEILSDNSLLFQSSLSVATCESGDCTFLSPTTPVNSSTSTCTSVLVLQDQDIIFTVDTELVMPVKLVGNATTVSVSDLANLIVAYADSIETAKVTSPSDVTDGDDSFAYAALVSTVYADFPLSSFDSSYSSALHAKLCASSSLVLNFLWSDYEVNVSNAGLIGMVGNAFDTYTVPIPLYHVVQLTYISTADIAAITGAIMAFACLVCVVGMASAVLSRINVKPATDSSLLYNADPVLIARKQALMSGLSNDPHGQLALEFKVDSVLYCRELTLDYPNSADPTRDQIYSRVNISYRSEGAAPNAFDDYH